MRIKWISVILWVIFLLTSCAPKTESATSDQQVDDIAQAVPQSNATGGISGTLSYPSSGIPPLVVVAYNNASGEHYWTQTETNQTAYQLNDLPVGSYHVFAYALPNGEMVGAYDQFVLCGLLASCTDMSLIAVTVQAGVITPNIHPANWYGDAEIYPPMPDDINITDLGVGGAGTTNAGSISGLLSFPAQEIPALMIVAFGSAGEYQYVMTNSGQANYQIDHLPAGTYTVVAYTIDGNLQGGYTHAVLCGLRVECADHRLIPVEVTSGGNAQNINPQDWYAPKVSFPEKPAQ